MFSPETNAAASTRGFVCLAAAVLALGAAPASATSPAVPAPPMPIPVPQGVNRQVVRLLPLKLGETTVEAAVSNAGGTHGVLWVRITGTETVDLTRTDGVATIRFPNLAPGIHLLPGDNGYGAGTLEAKAASGKSGTVNMAWVGGIPVIDAVTEDTTIYSGTHAIFPVPAASLPTSIGPYLGVTAVHLSQTESLPALSSAATEALASFLHIGGTLLLDEPAPGETAGAFPPLPGAFATRTLSGSTPPGRLPLRQTIGAGELVASSPQATFQAISAERSNPISTRLPAPLQNQLGDFVGRHLVLLPPVGLLVVMLLALGLLVPLAVPRLLRRGVRAPLFGLPALSVAAALLTVGTSAWTRGGAAHETMTFRYTPDHGQGHLEANIIGLRSGVGGTTRVVLPRGAAFIDGSYWNREAPIVVTHRGDEIEVILQGDPPHAATVFGSLRWLPTRVPLETNGESVLSGDVDYRLLWVRGGLERALGPLDAETSLVIPTGMHLSNLPDPERVLEKTLSLERGAGWPMVALSQRLMSEGAIGLVDSGALPEDLVIEGSDPAVPHRTLHCAEVQR